MLFGDKKSAYVHYIKAIMYKTYTLTYNSEEW